MADFTGDGGDNIFTGGSDPDNATGGGGNDQLNGNGGTDKLSGDAGADTLNGGDGDDQLFSDVVDPSFTGFLNRGISYDTFAEFDVLNGGAGDDYIFAGYGDSIDGGTPGSFGDRLFISFQGATSGVSADFRLLETQTTMTVGATTISNIDNIGYLEGSNFNDFLVPTDTYYPSGANVYGRGGDDHLLAHYYTGWGGSGLYGGDGDDIVDGRPGLYGASVYGEAGNDTLYAGGGSVDGGDGDDTIYADNVSYGTVYGGAGNDTIYSGGTTYGGAGNDWIVASSSGYPYGGTIYGEDGADEIEASTAGSSVSGGGGGDRLRGNSGNDTLISGDFAGPTTTPADDMGLEVDGLTGAGGDDKLAIGYGDSADGGIGNDTLRLSLGGLASGITFDTAGVISSAPYVLGGGTIQNFETLEYLRGTNFADTLTIATQAILLAVNAGDGNDTITTSNSSVSLLGGNGDDLLISGAAGDIFDGGTGIDTVDYRNATSGVTVTLGVLAGQMGTGGGGDQLTYIENVTGSAHSDTLSGTSDANTLQGMAGNDTLDGKGGNDLLVGGLGADTMAGGLGDDVYVVDNALDVITEGAAEGASDYVLASVSYALGAGVYVEKLTTTNDAGTTAINLGGNAIANELTGNAGANWLAGLQGNDVLDGGLGADHLQGGTGNDTYYVDNVGDWVHEEAGEGTDLVIASISHELALEVENLTLAGSGNTNAGGNALANLLTGNAGTNWLASLQGDDVLDGGLGADKLQGGTGNDTYHVDNTLDWVIESAGEGTDQVFATISYELTAEVENLTLAGSSNTSGGGNVLANVLTGNAGSNWLAGVQGDDVLDGGLGADHLQGGTGNDTYHVDNTLDWVHEEAGEGTDLVLTAISFELATEVENLTLTGTGNTSGGGNGLANVLTGNAGNNWLASLQGDDVLDGGLGADKLQGGTGNDTYHVDNTLDWVIESAGEGTDQVIASISHELGAEVENLTLAGSGDTNAGGNALANVLTGNAGNNWLASLAGNDVLDGGLGADRLDGGADQDTFAFTTALGGGNVDWIADFAAADDTIQLDDAVFTGLAAGALASGAFATGAAATEADDRVIYDANTGALLFDADGLGGADAVQFATLNPGLTLTSADFLVI